MPKGKRGGKQPGSGRKKGFRTQKTIEKEKAREFMLNRIAKNIEPIVTAQIEAAKGMYVEKYDLTQGTLKVFLKEPDLKAGEYLLNQATGKPKETIEMEEKVNLKIDV